MEKKLKFTLILLTFVGNINAQTLAEKGGYSYDESHFKKVVQFTEFVCGTTLTDNELEMARQSELKEFNANPSQSLRNVENVTSQMKQLYTLNDPVKIGVARSALIAALYNSVRQLPDEDLFKKIFTKYNFVLALDPQNGLAFTQRDLDAYFDFIDFYSRLTGQVGTMTNSAREQNKQPIINQFLYGDKQTKTSLASMLIYNSYMQTLYKSLSAEDKKRFVAIMKKNNANNNAASGVSDSDYIDPNSSDNTEVSPEAYKLMTKLMLINHVSCMNAIEAIGDSGDYWEIVDY